MNLGIVCGCEGLLTRGKVLTTCTRCKKTYPTKDLEVILKLLRVADYEPSSPDQKPPTEDEKHNAVMIAARKLAAMKIKVMDIDELLPLQPEPAPAPPPQPVYRPAWSTTSTWAGNSPVGNVWVSVTIG